MYEIIATVALSLAKTLVRIYVQIANNKLGNNIECVRFMTHKFSSFYNDNYLSEEDIKWFLDNHPECFEEIDLAS